jgi:hypothetical protein
MEVSRVVLEYVRALVWPLIALTAFLSVRKELPQLFSRFRTGELKAAGVQMRVELAEVNAQIASGSVALSGARSLEAETEMRARFNEFFAQMGSMREMSAPANLVLWSFVALLRTVHNVAGRLGVSATEEEQAAPGFRGTHYIEMSKLVRDGVIGPNVLEAMNQLDDIYDRAVKDSGTVDADSALLFRQTAMALGEAVVMASLRR